MVPLKGLTLEKKGYNQCEDRQGDHFLDYLQLHKVERATVIDETDAVCRNLGAVFK